MTVTRSYNRHNDTYYAYETTYVYDETKKKKVMKRRCIGKFDEEGNIIPNGSRGRRKTPFPSKMHKSNDSFLQKAEDESSSTTNASDSRKQTIDSAVSETRSLVNEIAADVESAREMMATIQSRLLATETTLSTVSAMLDDLIDCDYVPGNPDSSHK